MADLSHPILLPSDAQTAGLNGAAFPVTAIASNFSDAQLVYTATNDPGSVDEITIEATNVDAATSWVLGVGWGGATTGFFGYTTIAPLVGPVVCVSGRRLREGAKVYVVCLTTALANGTASKLNIYLDRTRYKDT